MKRNILSFIMVMTSVVAMAQTDLWVWQNGVYTQMAQVDSITFTKPVGKLSYEAVDLGLSVNWATCNVGAAHFYEPGDYFAWGEVLTSNDYSSENYDFSIGTTAAVLDARYDAATVHCGGEWRMPTAAEIEELTSEDNTKWTWYEKGNTAFNGQAGWLVTSKKTGYTGSSIFLPCAGYYDGTTSYFGNSVRFWGASRDYNTGKVAALSCSFGASSSSESGRAKQCSWFDDNKRYMGFTIRAVRSK